MHTYDYHADYNLQRLAYIGINAMNYLLARKMLHSVSKEINCDDPIETLMHADKIASTISYNNMEPGGLKLAQPDPMSDTDTDYYLATL